MKTSRPKRFVRPSTKLLESVEKPVLPDHLFGGYTNANAHDLFGILPEPEEGETSCGNSLNSSTE